MTHPQHIFKPISKTSRKPVSYRDEVALRRHVQGVGGGSDLPGYHSSGLNFTLQPDEFNVEWIEFNGAFDGADGGWPVTAAAGEENSATTLCRVADVAGVATWEKTSPEIKITSLADPSAGLKFSAGDRCPIYYNAQAGMYNPLSIGQSSLDLYELTSDLTGLTCTAHKCPFSGGTRTEDTSVDYTLTNTTGMWGLIGERLWAATMPDGTIEVRSSGSDWYYGILDGACAAGSSATVSIWSDSGTTWVDSTVNVTAWAPFVLSTGSIASGKRCIIKWHKRGRWEIIEWGC